ncbi:hypothetical protein QCA50_005087 [Cerrena zonata]|uniref:Uncharacterized protein n=1 Tax=Cerrena zonata TaxID=2478898 RepID=A0AAW0GGD8_9APHY
MAIPAECPNCNQSAGDPINQQNQSSNGTSPSPNLGVIFGVLGGLALIAFIVVIVVPLSRRRQARNIRVARDVENSSTSERRPSLLSFLSHQRQSPFHHKKTGAGPDTLLPLLTPFSTFTWSDLQGSNNESTDTIDDRDGMEKVEVYSFPTDNATISHHGQDGWAAGGRSVKTGERSESSAWSAHVSASGLPSPQRSPAPPGLPSKSSPPADQNKSAQVAPSTFPIPNPTLVFSPGPLSHPGTYPLSVSSIELSMEHPVKAKSRSSRPHSIQLPSPPASPPVPQSSQSGSLSRSRSVRSNSNAALPQSDIRLNRFRPPISSNHSAPTALPFRPPTSSSNPPSSWTTSTAPSSSSTQSPPLTGAFRKGSSIASASSNDSPSRYPAVSSVDNTLPTSISRRRSGSTVSEMPPTIHRTPLESRLRPSDMLRRASLSTNAPVLPGNRLASSASSVMSLPIGGSEDTPEPSTSRAYLRMSGSHHTTSQYETVPSTHGGQSGSLSYFDPTTGKESSSATPRLSSSSHPLPNIPTTSRNIRPLPTPPNQPSSSTSLYPLPPENSQNYKKISKSGQPAYVKRKDSPALRPLPQSPFLSSPPTSPPLRPTHHHSRSRGGSISSLSAINPLPYSSRSRAGSVITLGETPFEAVREERGEKLSEEGSDADSRKSVRAVLPPLPQMAPLQFDQYTPGR